MCLAVPAKIISINDEHLAVADVLGVSREIALDLVPSAQIGSWVLVHAGFGIEVIDEKSADETLKLIEELTSLNEAEQQL